MQKQLEIFKKILDRRFFAALAGYFAFAFIFSFLAKWLADFKWFVKIDVAFQGLVLDARIDFLNNFFKIFTDLNDTKFVTIMTLTAALIFFLKKYYWHSIGIVLSVGISEFVSFILKNIIGRHRPPYESALISADSASFPSGHTIAAIAFFGFLAYFFYKNIKRKFLRIILIFICIVIILLAGFARIYLGVHWPSDVIAGYILGGVWLVIIINLINKGLRE